MESRLKYDQSKQEGLSTTPAPKDQKADVLNDMTNVLSNAPIDLDVSGLTFWKKQDLEQFSIFHVEPLKSISTKKCLKSAATSRRKKADLCVYIF